MNDNTFFFYQNFILIFMVGGGIAPLYALLHYGKKRWIAGGLALICALTIAWYFTPFRIYFAPDHPAEVTLIYCGTTVVTSKEQAQHLVSMCNSLVYTRQVGQARLSRSAQEYIYLRIKDEQKELNLELAVDEKGFSRYPGLHGITYGMDHINNPKELIAYVKSIISEDVLNI